jgi:hypothetical protein
MVSAAVAVAFVLEVFWQWKAAFMVFLLLLLLQDVLVGLLSHTPPPPPNRPFPISTHRAENSAKAWWTDEKLKNLLPNVGIH